MESSAREHAEATPPLADDTSGGIAALLNSVRRVFAGLFRLFSLEVRRAGLTLVWMVALGVLAMMLLAMAWMGLLGALALWAVSLGWTWTGAMLAVAMINLLTAAILTFYWIALSRNLLFGATQRQLEATPEHPDTT